MARVLRRPRAMADVLDVWAHIAVDSTHQADAWVERLDEALNLLATQPRMGRERDELAIGIRSFPGGRYLVYYLVVEGGIDVVRVLHASRDIESVFSGGE